VDPDSRENGIAASDTLPAVTRNGLREERSELSDKIMRLCCPVTCVDALKEKKHKQIYSVIITVSKHCFLLQVTE
jgi:hypothetical protein